MEVRVISNITKEYPDMIKVVIYKEPKVFTREAVIKRKSDEVDDDFYCPKISSLNRTKTLIKDIILCNDFEYFCTFTFDPKKVDSFNYNKCRNKISTWLHHQSDRSREAGKIFKYLIVPEQHKSGRWHFHALISGYTGSLRLAKVRTRSHRLIYNITSFRSGFTTCTPIDSSEGVANYVSKYITKEFIRFFNRRRFLCSRNLTRPVKTLNSNIFKSTLPIFRRCVGENHDSFEYVLLVN